jgi:hypothetical protein
MAMPTTTKMPVIAWFAGGLGAASIAIALAIRIGAFYQGEPLTNLGMGALVMMPSLMLSVCASALGLLQLHRGAWIPAAIAAASWLTLLAVFGVAGFRSLF